MVTLAVHGPRQIQEQGTSSESPIWIQGSRNWPYFIAFPGSLAGSIQDSNQWPYGILIISGGIEPIAPQDQSHAIIPGHLLEANYLL